MQIHHVRQQTDAVRSARVAFWFCVGAIAFAASAGQVVASFVTFALVASSMTALAWTASRVPRDSRTPWILVTAAVAVMTALTLAR